MRTNGRGEKESERQRKKKTERKGRHDALGPEKKK